jgi:hypothetical protein
VDAQPYNVKLVCACEALSHIRNGQTVFVGSGAAEQLLLTDTLAKMGPHFCDIEVFHLAAFSPLPTTCGGMTWASETIETGRRAP